MNFYSLNFIVSVAPPATKGISIRRNANWQIRRSATQDRHSESRCTAFDLQRLTGYDFKAAPTTMSHSSILFAAMLPGLVRVWTSGVRTGADYSNW